MTTIRTDKHAIAGLAKTREVEEVLLRGAQIGARGANNRAPVGEPPVHLGESYRAESEPGAARFGSDLRYAEFVEFGTEDTPAQPHIRPAVDDIKAASR